MAVRTSDQLVRATVETDADINLTPFINRAHALTDYVQSKDSQGVLNAELLREIETCLAAHFYVTRDQLYRERATQKASGVFQSSPGRGRLDYTDPGAQAVLLDVSGTLNGLNKGTIAASVSWLGKPPSEQIDYLDRD